ncbi:PREDICTED: uncharacterized protein LOC108803522 [Nanorana parkeri]|uniref:uncharacterized protein LOC108803522 n=1 Tax=Nanorana parkeri TaxID=125878 RepID=UPI00085466CC|nr:PREDICTED: uncharacterized protein LOC108803522 [Nanorana parkeri]
MCPLRVLLLLWALVCLGGGNVSGVQEEIFTRPGSDLLLPIRRHLTLSHTDGRSCDQYEWTYKDPSRYNETRLARHRGCNVTTTPPIFPNTRTSENGSLIIDGVTRDNDGVYRVVIHNSTGSYIQTDDYTVHVEVPVSVPVLNVSCLRNGSAEISCRVEEGTKPDIRVSVIGGSPGSYSASSNHITAIVGSPGPWNITCSVENRVSRLEMSRAEVTCPGIPSRWGHLLSHGAVCVLYTVLLICMVNDLRKMNGSERRTRRRRDRTEMEMEPTYYNERN